MKVRLDYSSFQLSAGTEAIRYNTYAEMFFQDHNIPHSIKIWDCYKEPDVKHIQWNEGLDINIPVNTILQMEQYCKYYHIRFIVTDEEITIEFLRN